MGRKKQSEEDITDILNSRKYNKSNALINSKGSAGIMAEKLFAIGIQQAVEDEKTGILTTTMRGKELKALFGTNSGSFYDKIKLLVDPPSKKDPSLLDWRLIYTDDTTKKVEGINVIMDASFDDGVFILRFNNKINNQVRKLQANYTSFSLAETMPLKSLYSFKLYEILKAEYERQDYLEKKKGTWQPNSTYLMEMHIVDLKLRMGVIDVAWSPELTAEIKKAEPDYDVIEKMADELSKQLSPEALKDYNKYKRIDNFKKNVLDRAMTELDAKTSIHFTYKPLSGGAGGKIYGFRFYISRKIKEQKNEEVIDDAPKKVLSDDEKLEKIFEIKMLLDSSFSMKDIRIIAEQAEYDVEKVKNAYKLMQESKEDVKNKVAWLRSAIKENYQSNSYKSNKFNDFQQNTYDFEELENQLLDN